jgi:hypothetical protein
MDRVPFLVFGVVMFEVVVCCRLWWEKGMCVYGIAYDVPHGCTEFRVGIICVAC